MLCRNTKQKIVVKDGEPYLWKSLGFVHLTRHKGCGEAAPEPWAYWNQPSSSDIRAQRKSLGTYHFATRITRDALVGKVSFPK